MQPGLEVVQQGQDLGLDRDVEGCRRLVSDQQFRFADQGEGDHRALAHAAGQLVGMVVEPFRGSGHPDEVEDLDRPGPGRPHGPPAVDAVGLDELVPDRPGRVE